MGISAGSAVLATGVKGIKNLGKVSPTTSSNFSQIWLEEEGGNADKVVNITKFQNFIFTPVILGVYVTMTWQNGTLPPLPDNVVWLIGISHVGYVGGKIPDKK
jgi:hypothetical protein